MMNRKEFCHIIKVRFVIVCVCHFLVPRCNKRSKSGTQFRTRTIHLIFLYFTTTCYKPTRAVRMFLSNILLQNNILGLSLFETKFV